VSRLTFVLGGARSGKSRYAQELAMREAGDRPVVYVATAQAGDDEMRERIARHQGDRPAHWRTVEEPLAVADVQATPLSARRTSGTFRARNAPLPN